MTGIKVELLQDATPAILQRLLPDDNWVVQEKHNGDRRCIQKNTDGSILDYNRDGEPGKGLPAVVKAALRRHPLAQFIIDVELVKDCIYVFDVLVLGEKCVAVEPYRVREAAYQRHFKDFDPCVIPVTSARTLRAKEVLIKRLRTECAEGFVMKDLSAPYRPSLGDQRWNYRVKFVKTLDAVVLCPSPEGHNSVRIGVFDANHILREIGGVSLNGKERVGVGDVVEVMYLTGTSNGHITQPRLLRKREDKLPTACTIDQLVIGKGQ